MPLELQKSFRLYVTHVDGEGQLLKICGQLDQPSSFMVESLFETARDNLDKGIGSVPPGAIQIGIICAAKYKDGAYYRARITSTTNLCNGLVGVYFIDYGNKDVIPLNAIRLLNGYDPMFMRLPGLVNEYYLARFMLSGPWEGPLLLMLQSILCYAEHPVTVESQTQTLPIISLQFKGTDLSSYLISNRLGVVVPVPKQKMILAHPGGDILQTSNCQQNFMVESPSYAEHVPLLGNQNLPSNPASGTCLQQKVSMPSKSAMVAAPSAISQKLMGKSARGIVNLKAPIRQLRVNPDFPTILEGTPTPPATATSSSLSPKKATSFKSHMLECNSEHSVFVSFLEDGPNIFTVQLMNEVEIFQSMMDSINRRSHTSLTEPPMIGTVCLGRISEDRIICRSIVMNLSGSQCKLYFVDLGDTEMVSYYDMFDIPEEFLKPTVFAIRFCLSGVKKLEKSPYLNETFKQLVSGKVMKLRVVPPEGPPLIQYGELYLNNQNVLDILLAKMRDNLQFKCLDMLQLGSQYSVLVSYVDSCLKFYVQLSDHINDLNVVMDAVKAHCERASCPGEMPVGAACCARFADDGNWYRACVRSTKDNKVVVAYVDYGNEQEVAVSDLRTITADLMKLPAQALKCALKGFENSPIEATTSVQLEKFILEKTLTANIVALLSGDTLLVTLIDDTVSPPLDVAREINNLLQPKSKHEMKVTTPVEKTAPEAYRPPEPLFHMKVTTPVEKTVPEAYRPPEPLFHMKVTTPVEKTVPEAYRPPEPLFHMKVTTPVEKTVPEAYRPPEPLFHMKVTTPVEKTVPEAYRPPEPLFHMKVTTPVEKTVPKAYRPPEPLFHMKVTTPVEKTAPRAYRPPEGGALDDQRFKFGRKDNQRRNSPEDIGQRAGNWRNRDNREPIDRTGHSLYWDKYEDRTDYRRGERRGKSREPGAPIEDWRALEPRRVVRQNSDNKFNKQDEWEEKKPEEMFSVPRERFERCEHCQHCGERTEYRGERTEHRGERRESWEDNKEPWAGKKESWGDRKEPWADKKVTWGDKREPHQPWADKKEPWGDKRQSCDGRDELDGSFTQAQYKELADPVPLDTPFAEPAVEPGAQHEVAVTWIVSPHSFYAQILAKQPAFLEMMHGIPEMYKGVRPYSGAVGVGASVLARYPADGVLYRATVVAVQPLSKLVVQYVDFGNKQLVDAKDIWQLERRLTELPRMAVHCRLLGVAPEGGEWRADPAVDRCFDAPRYRCVFADAAEGQQRVSLWSDGASVADRLVAEGLAVAAPCDPPPAVALKDEPIDLAMIVGQQMPCRVTHVESFDKLYVQLDLDKAALVERAVDDLDAAKLTPLAAEEAAAGAHCTVRHEGRVFRAVLGAAAAARWPAVLPDYGRTVTAALDDLMILPAELSVYYYQSLECRLHKYTAESKRLVSEEELRARLLGNKFIVYVDGVEGTSLLATLYDLATGRKLALFEPDEGAFGEVAPLCPRTVFGANFGAASVQHLQAPGELHLQRAADGPRAQALLDDLFAFYEEGSPEPLTEFAADTLCAAKSADENWYRAVIVSAADDAATVQYPDYGNSETVPKAQLRRLDPRFHEPCALALAAGLGLEPLGEGALARLAEWTADREVQATLAPGADGWVASLHLDGADLALRLVSEGLAAPRAPAPAAPPGCTPVYVSHIDTPGHFWLQPADAVARIDEVQAELQAGAAAYPELAAREVGALCAAQYSADELWYRARVLDLDADITTVRFVDYGNTDVLDNRPGLLRELPEALRRVEPLAQRASVNAVPTGTGQWSERAADSFAELVGDTAAPVDALVVLRDETTYVDLFVAGADLTDRLVAQGHAARAERPACGALPACFASHVNSPAEFWIQLESAAPELQAMEAAMVDAERFPALPAREEGALCAAKYPEDEAWYRAQVVADGSGGTEVLFTDYGNASIAAELRSLPAELAAKPALSRKCALQKPRHVKAWSRRSEARFADLAAEGATVFKVQFIASGDVSIVELFLDGRSVTEELLALCEERPELDNVNDSTVKVDLTETSEKSIQDAEATVPLQVNETEVFMETNNETLDTDEALTEELCSTDNHMETVATNIMTVSKELDSVHRTSDSEDISSFSSASKLREPNLREINDSENFKETIPETIDTDLSETLLEEIDSTEPEPVAHLTDTDQLIETVATDTNTGSKVDLSTLTSDDDTTSVFPASKDSEPESIKVLLEEENLTATPVVTSRDIETDVLSQISEIENFKETIPETIDSDDSSETLVEEIDSTSDTDQLVETEATYTNTDSKVDLSTLTSDDDDGTFVFPASKPVNVNDLTEEVELTITSQVISQDRCLKETIDTENSETLPETIPETNSHDTETAVSSETNETEDETISETIDTEYSEALLEEIDSTNKMESEQVTELGAQLTDTDMAKGIEDTVSITVSKGLDSATPNSNDINISSVFTASEPTEESDLTVTSEVTSKVTETAVLSQISETEYSKQSIPETMNPDNSKVIPEEIDPTYKIDSKNYMLGFIERSETDKPAEIITTDSTTNLKEVDSASVSHSEAFNSEETIPETTDTGVSQAELKENYTIKKIDPNAPGTISVTPPSDDDKAMEHVDPDCMTVSEEEVGFEDACDLNSSHSNLDENLESKHTVNENDSFKINSESLDGTNDKANQLDSPNIDISLDMFEKSDLEFLEDADDKADQLESPKRSKSSETLETPNDTIKTPERDESKDSVNTDTGYTSCGDGLLSEANSPLMDQPNGNLSTTSTTEKKLEADE